MSTLYAHIVFYSIVEVFLAAYFLYTCHNFCKMNTAASHSSSLSHTACKHGADSGRLQVYMVQLKVGYKQNMTTIVVNTGQAYIDQSSFGLFPRRSEGPNGMSKHKGWWHSFPIFLAIPKYIRSRIYFTYLYN